jgi:hypothetical protein
MRPLALGLLLTVCVASSLACCCPSAPRPADVPPPAPPAKQIAEAPPKTPAAPEPPPKTAKEPPPANEPPPAAKQSEPEKPAAPKVDERAERKAKWRAKIEAEIDGKNKAANDAYDTEIAALKLKHQGELAAYRADKDAYDRALPIYLKAKVEYDAARRLKSARAPAGADESAREDYERRFKDDYQKARREIIKLFPGTQAALDAQSLLDGKGAPYRKLPPEPTRPAPPSEPALALPPRPQPLPYVYPPSPEEIAEEKAIAEAKQRAAKAADEIDFDGLVLVKSSLNATLFGTAVRDVTGVVLNRTGRAIRYAQIRFNLYNDEGAQVGTASASITDLDAGGRWSFRAITFNDRWSTYRVSALTGR